MNFSYLDNYIDYICKNKNIPAVGVAVYRYGKLLHDYSVGYSDIDNRKPFQTDSLINLYSCSKVSTATAGMILVERGILDLDSPVYDYLPEIKNITVKTENGDAVPAKNTMLIRHLFSMSAGFSYDISPELRQKLMDENHNKPELREVVQAIASEPLLFEPGTHFKYSYCLDVLGAVIEIASGMKFSDFLRRNIFEPAGMVDTTFKLTEAQRPRMALEYHGFDDKTGRFNTVIHKEGVDMGFGEKMESGGGGLISSINDYGKLAATMANGGTAPNGERILNPETIALMQENQLNPDALRDFEQFGGWSKAGYGYGLGVRTLIDRERNNSLSENGEFGWDGALGCYFAADPKTGIGIFYAQQEGGKPWWTWHNTVKNHAYACVMAE